MAKIWCVAFPETYEEIFPRPEQRIDVADLLHNVQSDDRFLRSLFSELLDDDDLKLLNESKFQLTIYYYLNGFEFAGDFDLYNRNSK